MLHDGTIVNNYDTEATETAHQQDQEILKFHEFHKDRSQIIPLRQVKLIQKLLALQEQQIQVERNGRMKAKLFSKSKSYFSAPLDS